MTLKSGDTTVRADCVPRRNPRKPKPRLLRQPHMATKQTNLRSNRDLRSLARFGGDSLRSRLEDHSISFIASNDAIELSKVPSFIDWNAEFFDFESAGIVDDVSLHYSLGVVAGKAIIGIDWGRQIVHRVAGR